MKPVIQLVIMLIFLCVLPVQADIPPEIPRFAQRVQINTSNVMWPNRVFLRWQISDGSWWCIYDTKEAVRAAMIQNMDDMLAPTGSGATSWRDVNLNLFIGAGSLGVFEKTWCFSWLP